MQLGHFHPSHMNAIIVIMSKKAKTVTNKENRSGVGTKFAHKSRLWQYAT